MKFSDIDFSAIKNMMDSLSDQEKEQLNTMAEDMMSNMGNPFEQAAMPVEEEEDLYALLNLDEEVYGTMPSIVLDQLENAAELEDFYSEETEPDLSAAALFYIKALQSLLRAKAGKYIEGKPLAAATLYDFIQALLNDGQNSLAADLQQVWLVLNQAEYAAVDRMTLDHLKELLFEQGLMLGVNSL